MAPRRRARAGRGDRSSARSRRSRDRSRSPSGGSAGVGPEVRTRPGEGPGHPVEHDEAGPARAEIVPGGVEVRRNVAVDDRRCGDPAEPERTAAGWPRVRLRQPVDDRDDLADVTIGVVLRRRGVDGDQLADRDGRGVGTGRVRQPLPPEGGAGGVTGEPVPGVGAVGPAGTEREEVVGVGRDDRRPGRVLLLDEADRGQQPAVRRGCLRDGGGFANEGRRPGTAELGGQGGHRGGADGAPRGFGSDVGHGQRVSPSRSCR